MKAVPSSRQNPVVPGSTHGARAGRHPVESASPASMVVPTSEQTIPSPPPTGCDAPGDYGTLPPAPAGTLVSPRAETLPAPAAPNAGPDHERETLPVTPAEPRVAVGESMTDEQAAQRDGSVRIPALRPVREFLSIAGMGTPSRVSDFDRHS